MDPAAGGPVLSAFEEIAVSIRLFEQAVPAAGASHVLVAEFVRRQFEMGGDIVDFGLINPDITWGAATAIATLGASKAEAIGVPR